MLGGASTTGTLSYTGNSATYTRGFTVSAGGGQVDTTTSGQTLIIGTGGIDNTSNGLLTIGGAGNTTIASVIGPGSGGLTKTGAGTLVLSGSNTLTGPVSLASAIGTLRLDAGGVLNATTLTVSAASATGTNQFVVNGGTFTASGATTVNPSSTAGRVTAIVINSGSAAFNTVSMGNSNGGLFKITGGNVTMASFDGGRGAATPYDFTFGFVMTGGTTIISGSAKVGNSNNGSSMSIEGGSLTTNGAFYVVGSSQSASAASDFRVIGGRFAVTDTTTGFFLNAKGGSSIANATLSGGVSTIDKLDMGNGGSISNVTLSGGSLYAGTGGWINSGGATSTITLTSGTLAAKGSWSSSLAMTTGTDVANSVTIKAADESDASFNITLSGALSGSGSIVKTGSGTLTLSGTNTYTGPLELTSGL